MAIRIQLRRDTAANWTSTNPVLRAGEFGIETDTLKFKIGNGSSTWTQITNYANVTSSGLTTSLNDYILEADLGNPSGPAKLNSSGDLLVPENSIILWDDVDYTYRTTVTATQPTADRTITLPNATGTVALAENVAALSGATFTGNISVPTAITFEGATANDFETTIQVTDPTADRTITIPDVGGTFVTTGDTGSVTNTMLAGSIANDKLSNSAITINGTSTSLGGTRTLGTDDVSEGTTNKYFTDERAQDAVSTALAAGTHTNITVTYNDAANSISLAAAPGYVDEQAVDAVATALAAGTHTNISVSYNDVGNAISLTGAVTYTDENAQDAIGNAVGTGLSYNDTTGAISVDTTAIQAKVANVDDTEIGYLNGVTSGIQTQIDNKASLSGATFTGAVSGTSLTLSGDLTVNGTTTTLNSTTISVDDKNIELGSVATPSDATADGGGITLKGATDKTFNWVDATDAWTSSEHVNLASGKSLYLNGTLLKDATETLTNKTINANANTITATSANVSDFNEAAQDAVGTILSADLVYNDSTPGIALNYVTVGNTLLDGVSGSSYGLIGTSTYLDVKNTNGYNKEIELDIAAVKTQLNTDGYLTTSSTSTLTNKTLTSPKINEDVALTATATELNYVDGVTSAIQTQLDAKAPLANPTFTGTLVLPSTVNGPSVSTSVNLLFPTTGGHITLGGSQTTGNLTIGGGTQRTTGVIGIGTGVTTTGTKTINLGTGSTGGTTAITIGSADGATSNIALNGITTATTLNLTNALGPIYGGTGLTSYSSGDILYASATNTLAKLAAGTNGQILTLASGVPSWAAAPITLPTQTDNAGKYLTTDGTNASWGTLVVPITTGTSTVSANTATTIDTTALSAFTSIEYMVSLKQGSKIRTSKVVVQTDGTSVDMTEFAITETGGTIAGVVVSVAVSSTNAVLQLTATDAVTTNVTVKFSKVAL